MSAPQAVHVAYRTHQSKARALGPPEQMRGEQPDDGHERVEVLPEDVHRRLKERLARPPQLGQRPFPAGHVDNKFKNLTRGILAAEHGRRHVLLVDGVGGINGTGALALEQWAVRRRRAEALERGAGADAVNEVGES